MKKVIASFAVLVALTGVIVVKANEAKFKATATAVYFEPTGGGNAIAIITSSVNSKFQTAVSGTQAIIYDNGNNPHLLYQEAAKSTPVYFVP